MPIVANVVHPAYVTYVPKRGRKQGTVIARAVTPVRVPEADAAGFERPGIHRRSEPDAYAFEPWIRDGKAWRPLRLQPIRGEPQAPALGVSDLVDWLGGVHQVGSRQFRALNAAFDGTPISRSLGRPSYANHALVEHRGGEHDDARVSRIVSDDRPESAAAVAAFVRDEILVADGIPLTRFRPVRRMLTPGSEDLTLTREVSRRHPVFGLDRDADIAAYGGKPRRTPADVEVLRGMLRGVDAEDWDVVAMANALPGAIRGVTEPLARGHRTLDDALRAAFVEADARLLRLERLGERGMIAPEAVPAALEAMRESGRMAWEVSRHSMSSHLHDALSKALAYIERVALPRLRETDLGADADALGGLAP